jgi:hypothetical protein
MWKDIHSKIMTANRAYPLSRNTKLKTYKTLIRLILSYGSETWKMSEEMNALIIFERKIVKKSMVP